MARVADPLLFDRRGVGEQRCIDIEEGRKKKEREKKKERKRFSRRLSSGIFRPKVEIDKGSGT